MKTIHLLTILALTLLSAACKKTTTSGSVKQQISLKADGVLFSVTTGDAGVTQSDAHIRDGNKFQLDATTSTKDFSINNQNVPSTGSYNMTGAGNAFNFVQWEDGSELFSSLGTAKSHLTFNISNIAGSSADYIRYVEGTFSGVIYNSSQTDSVKITDGQINIIE
ncbi:MAG: hypothetical protein IPM95_15040 [Sphingobacteriales bacterium]|jgi:hypothetical protein|nr:hypothetical protein [Sphingobacteriales bacterium]